MDSSLCVLYEHCVSPEQQVLNDIYVTLLLPGLAWSLVMTSYISTMGQIPSVPCWVVSTAQTFQIASRAAPTRSSWLSAAMPRSAAMDLCCSTQVGTFWLEEGLSKNTVMG